MNKINIKNLVNNQKTYPNWSTKNTYQLKTQDLDKEILVYYKTISNRYIYRKFPKNIKLTPFFIYVLGLLKGEGSNSIKSSNYRRFTITNTDPLVINLILNELDKSQLFKKSEMKDKSIHILHHKNNDEMAIKYWSNNLKLPKSKFICYEDKSKTSENGVCHIYISDVLLRRVVDLIHGKFNLS